MLNQTRSARLLCMILLAALLPPLAVTTARGDERDLKIMSFNVRYSHPGHSEAKAENNWNDSAHPRRERAIRVIADYGPDVLGIQEAYHSQVRDLQAALKDHEFYGVGRNDGKTAGEYSGLFFRRDRFEPVAEGSFWLSSSPETPGTTFHTRPGAVPRIASWVKLKDKAADRELLVLNMHWDHESEPARQKSAELVRARLVDLAKGIPAIVMGDLNSNEDSPAIKLLLGSESAGTVQLWDSFREMHPDRGADEVTYNNWDGLTTGSHIDFILHTSAFKPTAAEIVRTSYEGFWPSDHYPVTATLQWRDAD